MTAAATENLGGSLFARHARLNHDWHHNVLLQWDQHGVLTHVSANIVPAELADIPDLQQAQGPVIPGMPNLHSHAFQSAMAGLTEYRAQADDSFWSWRDLMYRFAARLSPQTMGAIAHHLYIDMLKAGYTSVCEFHYVHHQPDGSRYPQTHEMAARVVDAAAQAGIGITMLPVLYQYSNFGAQAPLDHQRRFLNSPSQLLDLLEQLRSSYPETGKRRYGAAPHSLRAVSVASLTTLLEGLKQQFPQAPIHIHIAEQIAEVDACLALEGARPVQWLLDNFPVDAGWCLVHATHMDTEETRRVAQSGAVVGLCPTTEANLGDGIFPARDYLTANGRFGLGSDSHIAIDWRSELRLLEYGQRLKHRRRNVLASTRQPQVADHLFDAATQGGAVVSGRSIGKLGVGHQADFLVLDPNHPGLAELPTDAWLSGLVFNERGHNPVQDVYVAGQRRIHNGQHPDEERASAHYRQALTQLFKED